MTHWQITEKNLAAHEWIGLSCRVIESTDPSRKNIHGTIVDESKNTLTIQTTQSEKKIPKKEVELQVELDSQKVRLRTADWCMAPENRIKAFFKNKKR